MIKKHIKYTNYLGEEVEEDSNEIMDLDDEVEQPKKKEGFGTKIFKKVARKAISKSVNKK